MEVSQAFCRLILSNQYPIKWLYWYRLSPIIHVWNLVELMLQCEISFVHHRLSTKNSMKDRLWILKQSYYDEVAHFFHRTFFKGETNYFSYLSQKIMGWLEIHDGSIKRGQVSQTNQWTCSWWSRFIMTYPSSIFTLTKMNRTYKIIHRILFTIVVNDVVIHRQAWMSFHDGYMYNLQEVHRHHFDLHPWQFPHHTHNPANNALNIVYFRNWCTDFCTFWDNY